jgi:hypothetical protein
LLACFAEYFQAVYKCNLIRLPTTHKAGKSAQVSGFFTVSAEQLYFGAAAKKPHFPAIFNIALSKLIHRVAGNPGGR